MYAITAERFQKLAVIILTTYKQYGIIEYTEKSSLIMEVKNYVRQRKKPDSNDEMSPERYCKMLQGLLAFWVEGDSPEVQKIAEDAKKEMDEIVEKWKRGQNSKKRAQTKKETDEIVDKFRKISPQSEV